MKNTFSLYFPAQIIPTQGALRFWIPVIFSVFGLFQPDGLLRAESNDLQTIKSIQTGIKKNKLSEEILTQWTKDLTLINSSSNKCVIESQKSLETITADLGLISEKLKGEVAEVTRQRTSLKMEKQEIEKALANCRVRNQLSQELLDSVSSKLNKLKAKRLFAKGPTTTGLLVTDSRKKLEELLAASKRFLSEQMGFEELGILHSVILLVSIILCVRLGVGIRRICNQWANRKTWSADFSSCFYRSISVSTAHYAPYLLPSGLMALYIYFLSHDTQNTLFIEWIAYGLPCVFLANSVVRLFIWPPLPAEACFNLPLKAAQSLARRLEVLVALIFVGYLLFSTFLQQSLPEHTILLARGLYAGILILNLIWITRLLGEFPTFSGTAIVRLLIQLLLLLALITEWSGYRNFSVTVLKLMFGSIAAIGITLLLSQLLKEFFEGLEYGRRTYHRKIRGLIGLKPGIELPGQLWFQFLAQACLWLLFAWSILYLWGFSETLIPQIFVLINEGFTIGSLKIVPSRIFLAFLTFSILILLNSWFRAKLETKWITKIQMGRGARETAVTMVGYIGVAIAILVTLGVAGITFTNLAIIAGALSVGIGFGLQNVVNNFVSGLILLFERPIKTGDWISVGNTEGYVKRIRIRSTQIQTFDRADVIVPNSELISGQVTNWMLYDPKGRIRVPIGVAYGSDTEKVKQILLEIASKHPGVMNDNSVPEPKVLFRAFGESSLDMELRCFVYDIDARINITSDINFAIDKAFREHKIEIPYPKRDVYIHSSED